MTKSASLDYQRTMFPLLWTIMHRYRRGELEEPFPWIAATHLPTDIQVLANALELYLARDSDLADFVGWVLSELPQRQGHFIDSETDLLWSFVIIALVNAQAGSLEFTIGPATHSNRDRLLSVVAEIRSKAIKVAEDFHVRQIEGDALPRLEAGIRNAIERYEAEEESRLVKAELDVNKVVAFRNRVVEHWATGFPYAFLQRAGSVHFDPGISGAEFLGRSLLVPKEAFVSGSGFVDTSADFLADGLANALSNGESAKVASLLAGIPKSRRGKSLASRIRSAIGSLEKAGRPPTHLLIPVSFHVLDELAKDGLVQADDRIGRRVHWKFGSIDVVEWNDTPSSSVVLLHLPEAIQQHIAGSDGNPLQVDVEKIDEAMARQMTEEASVNYEEGPPEDPIRYLQTRVRVVVGERVRLSVQPASIRLIALPDDLASATQGGESRSAP